jgi:serine/threonine protein kinase
MTGRTFEEGSKIGRYRVLRRIGEGAMAEVFLARDERIGREVALKVLRQALATSEALVQRFEREARLMAGTTHPNVVAIFEVGRCEAVPYIAMEYVRGRTLREALEEGTVTVPRATEIAAQIADALTDVHRGGIVHRDLKPENVMLGDDGFVKIIDFGLSKSLAPQWGTASVDDHSGLTLPGTILGTVAYMSPEQARGRNVDFRSDQFSLGSVLYEMITGIAAFQKDTLPKTLTAVFEGEPEPLSRLEPSTPGNIAAIVDRCLSKDPAERFPSMKDLADALWKAAAVDEVKSPLFYGRIVAAFGFALFALTYALVLVV